MADQKISELSNGGLPQAGDKFLIARNGDNYNIDGGALATAADIEGLSSQIDGVGTVANAAQAQADTATSEAADAASAAADAATLAGSAISQADAAFAQANTATTAASTAASSAGAAYNQANSAITQVDTLNSAFAPFKEPTTYLYPSNSISKRQMHPNSIPQTSSIGMPVAANAGLTYFSVFYTGVTIRVSNFSIYCSNVNGGSRTLGFHLYGFDPVTLNLGLPYYKGTEKTVNAAGPVADASASGVIGPGWYASIMSVSNGTTAFSFQGVAGLNKYTYANIFGQPSLGAYTIASYYAPGTQIQPTASAITPYSGAFQIPFDWIQTSLPVGGFGQQGGGAA